MDAPLYHPVPFQIWFNLAVWWCGLTEIIQMNVCGFFQPGGRVNCGGKDFLAMMYYITAIPAMMMFVVTHRIYTGVMMVVALVLIATLIMPEPGQGIFARNMIAYIIFCIFLQALHYNKEVTERRLYLLNSQLKVAYRAQQKAQIAQSRASQAKRRFASYIFHEVRVPLNNAAIAFNNLMISNLLFDRISKPHVEDVKALEVSLETVQQVLNDALDLEKMDAGRFEIKPRNFPLHTVIRSTLAPLVITAAAKKLELKINLDPRIDALAHRMIVPELAITVEKKEMEDHEKERDRPSPQPSPRPKAFEAADYISGGASRVERTNSGSTLHSPKRHRSFKNQPQTPTSPSSVDSDVRGDNGELWVVGDEVRLRQVLTNLVSNAIKFTPTGSKEGITFSTSLVTFIEGAGSAEGPPQAPDAKRRDSRDGRYSHDVEKEAQGATQDVLVIRMEIADNGPGIKPSDLVDGQLFQPFGQTRVGRLSRNSTGLGLAIVRQIVLNSAGRLGVQSQKGRGATFWVELSYPVAKMRVNPAEAMKSYFTATGSLPPSTIINSAPDGSASPVPNSPPPGLPLTPLTELSESTIAVNTPGSFDASSKLGDLADSPLDRTLSSPPPTTPPTTQSPITEVPRTDNATSPPFSLPAAATTESEEKLLVLVVDDDPLTRKMLSRSLGFRNCTVHTAQDGKECVDLLLSPDAPDYDLVTLDNYMPVMTGEEAVKEIRNAGKDVFVVGCTGNALTDDQNSYLEAGADRVLPKPINYKSGQLEEILQIARQRRMERQQASES
ncbi:hypothetical protein PM082_006870 [Marasmius tenuissimus]|nr:hypothetical protein PM082_006870 [Marasmius tenuissimus]